MIRRPPRSTQSRSSAASDVYKRQEYMGKTGNKMSKYLTIIVLGVLSYGALTQGSADFLNVISQCKETIDRQIRTGIFNHFSGDGNSIEHYGRQRQESIQIVNEIKEKCRPLHQLLLSRRTFTGHKVFATLKTLAYEIGKEVTLENFNQAVQRRQDLTKLFTSYAISLGNAIVEKFDQAKVDNKCRERVSELDQNYSNVNQLRPEQHINDIFTILSFCISLGLSK
eukprot:TRINITY_DN1218_c0_g1_i3.p1 TRINITY_DN1218_c0_g1~~TRINITY_DN1218_c0_g1_i3.p1  ORF type:complete len:225 (+),score=33.15 TRINITY_DN1218_c0_g1_i3:33-707(+)